MRSHITVIAAALLLGGSSTALAQSPADPSGHWEGSVEVPGRSLPFVFDVARNAKGEFTGTVSGADVRNLPLTKIAVTGRSITLQASSKQPYNGELSADGRTMSGTVTLSGYTLPLELTRKGEGIVEPAPTSPGLGRELEGTWQGTLTSSQGAMRVVMTIANQPDGRATAHIVSVDEGGLVIPLVITQNAAQVSMTSPVIPISWAGSLSADLTELSGTYTGGGVNLPLRLRRGSTDNVRGER